jgi:hypothetical protein
MRQTRISFSVKTGLAAVGLGVTYLAGTVLFGLNAHILLSVAAIPMLLIGGMLTTLGLLLDRRRGRSFAWARLAILFSIVAILYAIIHVPGARLLDYHTQLLVARTGGRAQLQAWALDILAKPHAFNKEKEGQHANPLPEEYWSDQVRRLRPVAVNIGPVSGGKQDVVWLGYGRTLWQWSLVIGPPGFAPDPNEADRTLWMSWGNGLYDRCF